MRRFFPIFTLIAMFVTVSVFAQESADARLEVGDPIPTFHLAFANKDTVSYDGITSQSLRGQRYLIATFPAPFSSGCTKEMCTFRDEFQQLKDLNVKVLPVSGDYIFATYAWAKELKLQFDVMADPTRGFGKELGVYLPDNGRFQRAVFVVGPDGKLEYIDYEYSVADDADFNRLKEALAELK